MDNFRSKLKRKKSSTENIHPETFSRETQRQTQLLSVSDTAQETRNSAWWCSDQLSPAESLWAFTLRSALPNVEKQLWEPVPDLPLPSQVRPAAPQGDELWCGLSAEVAPLPEPASASPDLLRLDSFQQEVPAAQTSDGQPSSPQMECLHGSTASSPGVSERQPTSLHSLEEGAPSGKDSGSRGVDQDEAGSLRKWISSSHVKRKDMKEKAAKNEEKRERMESVTGGGGGEGGDGGRLQSCPMCLMVFPLEFTQMDCDGHLAQCLSEMNVDMTW